MVEEGGKEESGGIEWSFGDELDEPLALGLLKPRKGGSIGVGREGDA